jgi:hypothetical protein
MPKKLIQGFTKSSIAANFKELNASKTPRSRSQKIAIVLATARKAAAKAGKPSKGPKPPKRSKKKG